MKSIRDVRQPDEGDRIIKFNRYYVALNPNPAAGPTTWRISDPDEMPCEGLLPPPPEDQEYVIASVAPLMIEGDSTGVKYYLDISEAPDIFDLPEPLFITSIEGLTELPLIAGKDDNPFYVIYDLNDKAAVSSLAIGQLPHVPRGTTLSGPAGVIEYNSSSSSEFSIEAEPPIFTDTIQSLTELSIDIDALTLAP